MNAPSSLFSMNHPLPGSLRNLPPMMELELLFHEPQLARWTQRDQSPRFDGQCRWCSVPGFSTGRIATPTQERQYLEPPTPPGRSAPAAREGVGGGVVSHMSHQVAHSATCPRPLRARSRYRPGAIGARPARETGRAFPFGLDKPARPLGCHDGLAPLSPGGAPRTKENGQTDGRTDTGSS